MRDHAGDETSTRWTCSVCDGRGYLRCDCRPGDCICGHDDEPCDECAGTGVIGHDDDDWDCYHG